MPAQRGFKVIAKGNRAAFHNYYIEERYESGLNWCGTRSEIHPRWQG